jgi:transposase
MKHNRRWSPGKPRVSPTVLDRINPNVAGIDCGAAEHFVAVPPDRAATPVQSFQTFTSDLLRLADWLTACRVQSVAMEAPEVYWIPIYEILEARGFEVLLVNARHLKNVPGRQSDVSDCEWIRELHRGLLRGSFRPPDALVALRAYLRHRQTLIDSAGTYVQRMQKALIQMNRQLPLVISDITGVTGLRILRGIVAGQRDPEHLAEHRDHRCRATKAEIIGALTGHYRPEHLFIVQQNLELFDTCQAQLAACDLAIEAHVRTLTADVATPGTPLPAPRVTRKPRDNEPRFEIRTPLHRLNEPTGTPPICAGCRGRVCVFQEYVRAVTEQTERVGRLETELHEAVKGWRLYPLVAVIQALRGLEFTGAIILVAELGDLTRFDTPRKLMSYLGLTPSEYSSGERRGRRIIGCRRDGVGIGLGQVYVEIRRCDVRPRKRCEPPRAAPNKEFDMCQRRGANSQKPGPR